MLKLYWGFQWDANWTGHLSSISWSPIDPTGYKMDGIIDGWKLWHSQIKAARSNHCDNAYTKGIPKWGAMTFDEICNTLAVVNINKSTLFVPLLSRKQELLNISNVPLGECPPSPPRTAPPSMKVGHAHTHTHIIMHVHKWWKCAHTHPRTFVNSYWFTGFFLSP